ncbi:response regulator [Roseovarius aestuariivivens]|uniref:response regulator n=1 Tax=Roseovarius aestuariivivens TaxID=1888910 RepID=UPI0010820C27|nr:response regulator [Roseovarius aestuariivivens]
MTPKPPVTFLVVDDDDVAVMAIRRVVKKLRLTNPIERAVDGRDALDRLRDTGEEAVGRPFIILLDLNMPRMNGLEFLAELREDIELANSVVFVMTTSDSPRDIAAAYDHKIAGYIVKESAYDTFAAAMDMLQTYTEIVSFSLDLPASSAA